MHCWHTVLNAQSKAICIDDEFELARSCQKQGLTFFPDVLETENGFPVGDKSEKQFKPLGRRNMEKVNMIAYLV